MTGLKAVCFVVWVVKESLVSLQRGDEALIRSTGDAVHAAEEFFLSAESLGALSSLAASHFQVIKKECV